ncbi:MAG: hypothetical protein RQ833_01070 [Sphingomonadaceae bacterium]|nr:hypothetical protein [Sphingomonadaceae bacterium]
MALPSLGQASPPTIQDIDWARTTSMPGNFTHCTRIKSLRCERLGADDRYHCSYREYANQGPWPRKTIVVKQIAGEWRKLSGDTPACAIMNFPVDAAK